MSEELNKILRKLKALANPRNVEGMARFGISTKGTLGISVATLRKIAKDTGRNHKLALELWKTGIHEARMLSAIIDDYRLVTSKQMDEWVNDFDSWDICDNACIHLFNRTEFVEEKTLKWVKNEKEFVRRAGFALLATSAVHKKDWSDKKFETFLPIIKKYSTDERNFVRKAVNWALRQIGKRNLALRKKAIKCAKEILKIDSRSAKWIARDALKELSYKKI